MNMMKRISAAIIAAALLLGTAPGAPAVGFSTTIDSKNDTFIQEGGGRITGRQTTAAGAAHQSVGLRVRAIMPDMGKVSYTSRNNTYRQQGRIHAIQKTLGGASFQSVGLEVY